MAGLDLDTPDAPDRRDVWSVLRAIETRVARLEKLGWLIVGASLAAPLIRGCL